MEKGARFSECKSYRFFLWRIWDRSKPFVMFVGLNPSTANETSDDPTIRRVIGISQNLGYGGVFMVNCFPFVSTDPAKLSATDRVEENDYYLSKISESVKDVIFAWGNFKIVQDTKRDAQLTTLFPEAKALWINKNGSPKHPLYCKADIQPVKFR